MYLQKRIIILKLFFWNTIHTKGCTKVVFKVKTKFWKLIKRAKENLRNFDCQTFFPSQHARQLKMPLFCGLKKKPDFYHFYFSVFMVNKKKLDATVTFCFWVLLINSVSILTLKQQQGNRCLRRLEIENALKIKIKINFET